MEVAYRMIMIQMMTYLIFINLFMISYLLVRKALSMGIIHGIFPVLLKWFWTTITRQTIRLEMG
jgi:hypothetical protein